MSSDHSSDVNAIDGLADVAGWRKAYVLRCILPHAVRTKFTVKDSGVAEVSRAFALVVLSIISLAGGSISEGEF